MPAPRKPTNVLALAGAFKHDPKRGEARANEPESDGEMQVEPPEYLPFAEQEAWRILRPQAYRGTAGLNDVAAFAAGAKLFARLWFDPIPCETKDITAFINWSSRFGMNPADRSRLQVDKKPAAASPYAKFQAPGAR